jgi:50S ribosomal protein L16 3-hydroxylase
MVQFAASILGRISWTRGDVMQFLGEYLTQPKPHVVFKASGGRGTRLRLEPRSQLLYAGGLFFLNGDTVRVPARSRAALREFADRRAIEARRLAGLAKLIGEWRRAGYVRLDNG